MALWHPIDDGSRQRNQNKITQHKIHTINKILKKGDNFICSNCIMPYQPERPSALLKSLDPAPPIGTPISSISPITRELVTTAAIRHPNIDTNKCYGCQKNFNAASNKLKLQCDTCSRCYHKTSCTHLTRWRADETHAKNLPFNCINCDGPSTIPAAIPEEPEDIQPPPHQSSQQHRV